MSGSTFFVELISQAAASYNNAKFARSLDKQLIIVDL